MGKLFVFATVFAREHCAQQLFEELAGIVPIVRREKGCVRYDLHRSLDGQSFHFYEIWKDEKSLEDHLSAEHMLSLRERTRELIARETIVTRCESVDVDCG